MQSKVDDYWLEIEIEIDEHSALNQKYSIDVNEIVVLKDLFVCRQISI